MIGQNFYSEIMKNIDYNKNKDNKILSISKKRENMINKEDKHLSICNNRENINYNIKNLKDNRKIIIYIKINLKMRLMKRKKTMMKIQFVTSLQKDKRLKKMILPTRIYTIRMLLNQKKQINRMTQLQFLIQLSVNLVIRDLIKIDMERIIFNLSSNRLIMVRK